ncbi:peptidase inhibitor family I36 protein [Marinactinospora rubrisoli]|uniref:Peptidase inhibitor family I36 protein n=1 Tax=Marinactinospora rubrisoli TaxID=2715399 RepID=A0ABW2KI47_9ACTN
MSLRFPSAKQAPAVRRILVSTIAGLSALAAAALPASAQTSVSPAPETAQECPFTSTLCLYDEAGFGGERFTVSSANPGVGVCVDLVEHGWGGRARSAINTNTSSAAMFLSDDCTGQPAQIPSGQTPSLTFAPNSVFVS